ncbi:hypothetical protein P7C71_g2004, partial [Lecanoromycetidae sp. Uapishka_2]
MAHLLPAQSKTQSTEKRDVNFLAGNCQILWDSSITRGNPMDLYVFDNDMNQIHHDNVDLVPEEQLNVSFDCGLDVNCVIQGVNNKFPTFNYKKQVIPMPFPEDAGKVNSGQGADAAFLCACAPSDKAGYSGDTWVMCTFSCGPGYPGPCGNPGS